ncbi:DUF1353 domain-containing protein [Pontibacter sp. E15-1]|uniref:DUF1353 domain-containing protein n=1 Tax=Pontibacter sp. E15-1 TaxID=2919918 RepID=UPI001F50409F|nr:DUF1353 domain-containing protein [Pontibacter sp. E15-1]MCJ8165026.1 DUF1353 domain-containing protein [Pontibacter sp. E15-1]
MHQYAFYLHQDRVRIPNSYLPPPVLTYNPRIKRWILDREYTYFDEGTYITVPHGFEFDLASVPRAVWWAIAPFELSIVAPLLHDFLYENGGLLPAHTVQPYRKYTRREADWMFLEIMRREGVAEWKCRVAYNAVRTFGGHVWRGRLSPGEEHNLQLMPV